MEAYEEIRPSLDTGDLVFMSGKGWASNFIKAHTSSKFSHVGMILRFRGLFLYESTTLSDSVDVFTGKRMDGVQLVGLDDRIARYEGTVAIRRLVNFERTDQVMLRLIHHMMALHGRPYESSTLALIRAQLDRFGTVNEEDLSSVFCSELVAAAYKALGLIDPGIASSEWVPEDFAWRYVVLQGGAMLADEIIIKGEAHP